MPRRNNKKPVVSLLGQYGIVAGHVVAPAALADVETAAG